MSVLRLFIDSRGEITALTLGICLACMGLLSMVVCKGLTL